MSTTTTSQLVEVAIPTQTRTLKSRFDSSLLDAAVEMLGKGKTVNLHGGEPFEERSAGQVAAWYARTELARHMELDPKALRSRTFPSGTGFSYGVMLREDAGDDE